MEEHKSIKMTEEQVQEYLKSRGLRNHVWQGGSERLIQRWEAFVADIEKEGETRNWLIDDYWILLEPRELIHEIGHGDQVKDADKRFAAMLTATNIKHKHQKEIAVTTFGTLGIPKMQPGFSSNRSRSTFWVFQFNMPVMMSAKKTDSGQKICEYCGH